MASIAEFRTQLHGSGMLSNSQGRVLPMRRTWATFLDFAPEQDFTVEVANSGRVRTQTLRAQQRGLVRHRMLRWQLLGPWRPNVRVHGENARVQISPLRAVRAARGRSVLFICPSEALGDCVMYALAMQCIARRYGPSRLGVAFTGSASDVFGHLGFPVIVFPLVLPRDSLRTFDLVVEFEADLPAVRTIAESVITIDDAILDHLGLARTSGDDVLQPSGPIRRIALLPQSSTPIRSRPPRLTRTIATGLADRGMAVEVIISSNTRQGVLYREELAVGGGGRHAAVEVVSSCSSVDELIGRLRLVDYVVACDSGPAHLTKLLGLPGFAIYTAVAASVVQGSFRNLGTWQGTYKGSHCEAPCGLVGLMATRDGSRYGCMDTLRAERADLVRPARIPDAEVRRFLLDQPVGCVAAVARDGDRILAAILADIDRRSGGR